jgi:peptide/nickel transport system permease protein
MTDDVRRPLDRSAAPDPGSAPAVPIGRGGAGSPLPEPPPPGGHGAPSPDDRDALPLTRADARAPLHALMLGALLPGAGHLLIGTWARGVALLIGWGAVLGVAFFAWERIVAVPGAPGIEGWVALATLGIIAASIWGFALWDLTGGARRRAEPRGDSQWRIAARHFKKSRLGLAGLVLIVIFYLMALLAPLLAPFDPIQQGDLATMSYLSPSRDHLLGTDRFGRDVLSRILYGARISLAIGFIATAISITLGTMIGAVAGFFGGKIDAALMRFTDMVLAFPRLVLLIMIVALFEPSLTVIIAVLGLTQWPGTTRIVRGDVLSLREREFVQAARALGMGRARIIMRHLIPNVMAPVIVTATLGIGNTIVLEAGLAFLGLGIQPPTPTWGSMVADGRDNLIGAWWVATFPGLAIVLIVLAFNLVGDGLRDALDPRLRS